jgi:[ribosomal protein S18]-alanine N-acetyltransferase
VPARPPVTLRSYSPEDFETLYEIDQQCYPPEVAYSRAEMREYLHFPGADCVIACEKSVPVGFCLTAHRGTQGYLITIDVLASHRRLGVGSQLLAECESRLAAAGVTRVALEAATDSESAIAFWQKHGYRTRTIKKGYYPGGRDAFAMIKSIQPI